MMLPKDLTPLEKAVLLSGADEWTSRGNPRAGIAPFRMGDGPHGLRRQLLDWGEQAKRRKQADRAQSRGHGRVDCAADRQCADGSRGYVCADGASDRGQVDCERADCAADRDRADCASDYLVTDRGLASNAPDGSDASGRGCADRAADRQRADRASGRISDRAPARASEHAPARRQSAPGRRQGGDNLGLGESLPATCFPTATAVADSWDPALAEAMGRALGEEARAQGVDVLLGPGINIKRSPLCGRNFEYYSEDPLLAGRMAAGLIRGVQDEGVAACPKHFAANGQELRRQASNSVVDERTLREIYLTAFEIAVREARPWALMSSYNQINGVYAHENRHLLTEILRDEWGFDGAVISDWGGSNSAVAAVRAGGSLEMPSPGYTSARAIMGALRSGRLSMTDLDARVAEVARLSGRVHGARAHGARVHGARAHGGRAQDGLAHGERVDAVHIDGAHIDADYVDGARVDDSNPVNTRTGFADASRSYSSLAADTHTGIAESSAASATASSRRMTEDSRIAQAGAAHTCQGIDDAAMRDRTAAAPVEDRGAVSARPIGVHRMDADAKTGIAPMSAAMIDAHHALARRVAEESAVLLKNEPVLGRTAGAAALPLAPGARIAVIGDMARVPRYQGSGSSKVNATREENLLESLRADDGVTVVGYAQGYERHGGAEFPRARAGAGHHDSADHAGASVHARGGAGAESRRARALVDEAVALAARGDVDAVVVTAGLDERSEAEGLDRSTMAMPRPQNDLIEALATVCRPVGKPLVVVLVAGSPVELPWIDRVDAVLYAALAGQAGASAIARLLVGKANPCGHLAETWPLRLADAPTAGWYPARHRNAIYREGPFVGYRYHVTAGVPVRFPFGHGLSYSRFTYAGLRVDAGGAGAGVACAGADAPGDVDVGGVTFTVTNDSDVAGAAVAQLYVCAPEPRGPRPARELKGFAKVWLGPHESREVHIPFDRYTFRHWAGTGSLESGADAAVVIADGRDGVGDAAAVGPGAADSGAGWQVTSGDWTVMIGRNVDDIALATTCHVDGTVDPAPADSRLGAYLTGRVKEVTDANLCALFGVGQEAEGPEPVGLEAMEPEPVAPGSEGPGSGMAEGAKPSGGGSRGDARPGTRTAALANPGAHGGMRRQGRDAGNTVSDGPSRAAELDGILSALPPLPGIDPEEPAEFGPNDPILDWVGSSSPIARSVARRLIRRIIETRERHGEPDLDALFKLNMPPRVMVKLAGGLVDSRMVEGVVDIANGRTSRGLRRLVLGFLRNLVANAATARQLRGRR